MRRSTEPIRPPIFGSWTNFGGNLSDRITRLADRRFIAHHPAWPYLARRFGFQIVGTIQPQSGSEPSALQLHGLIAKIKKERIKVVVSEIQLSQKIPELLAKETGARVVVLTTLPGGLPIQRPISTCSVIMCSNWPMRWKWPSGF